MRNGGHGSVTTVLSFSKDSGPERVKPRRVEEVTTAEHTRITLFGGGGHFSQPPPMAVELLARDARASVPCPRPSERVGLAQVARRASDPLAPRSAWSLAGNSRHAVGAACVLVLTSMSSAWPFHRKVRPLTAVAPCAARICMLSKAHMLISHRPPAPHRS